MLDLGKEHDWFASSLIVALTAIAVVGFASFLVWELTEPDPIVALGVFRHRGFTISVVTLSLAFGAFFATNIITPLWLQSTMGYTATWAGYVTGGIGVLAIVGAPVAAKLSEKVDPRILIFVGILWLAGAAFLRGGASTDMTFWRITTLMVVTGLGMPFFFLPLTGIALASVSEEQTASAAGIMNFIRTVAGAFATSIVNTVWETSASRNQNELAGTLHEVERTLSGLEVSGMTRGQAVESITNLVVGQATMLATNQVFVSCALVFVVAAVTIWLAPKPTRASDTSAVH